MFLIILLIFWGCKKENIGSKIEDNKNSEVERPKIDFAGLRETIDNSTTMDIEVFFAISVCHKYQISQFQQEVEGKSEEEQKIFYLQKKNDFFKSIKYTEDQYNGFIDKNANLMNEYISNHPEIAEYLISTN